MYTHFSKDIQKNSELQDPGTYGSDLTLQGGF